MPTAGRPGFLPNLQGLRALAAAAIALLHISHDAIQNGADPRHGIATLTGFMPWEAGVDIFFVISGFVIVHASAPLFATGSPGLKTFLHRRLARIVPLYWIMTAAFLAVLWLGHAAIHGDIGGAPYIIASFLFIPWPRPDGLLEPAFGLGWTLNYEMFFYLVFTPFLLAPRRVALPAAIITLALLVGVGQFHHFTTPCLVFWSNPIILEFCFGMALARLAATGLRLPLIARLLATAAALILLHLAAGIAQPIRPLIYGLPACLLVAAATLAPANSSPSARHRLLVRLGDASYAMYLVHPFVMRGFSLIWHRFHAQFALSGIIYLGLCLAIAQALALAINVTLERKLSVWLRRKPGIIDETVQMPGLRPDRLL